MALDTRLIAQAQSGGRPLDIAGAIAPAIGRAEQAFERRRREENRRKELQAQAIAQLPQLDESKVPPQMREWAMNQAATVRQKALETIRNKDLGPVERQLALSNAMSDVNKIAAQANDFKQWIVQFADIESTEELSNLNSPELLGKINDIYQGKFKVVGDQFVFDDGTTKDFNALVNTRHISRRSDAFMNQLKTLGAEYEKYGLQGWDEKSFESKIDQELTSKKYTDADLASIAVDELDLPNPFIKAIQDDFEDNGTIDDPNIKNQLLQQIKNKYKSAAKAAYDNARRLYKEKTKVTEKPAYTPYQLFQMAKYNAEQNAKKNEYLGRAIPAINKLSSIQNKNDFTDIGKIQAITGQVAKKVGEDYAEYGYDSPGVVLGDGKYFISKTMDVNDVRQILANAMADSGLIESEEINDIITAIKPAGIQYSDPQAGTIPQLQLNADGLPIANTNNK